MIQMPTLMNLDDMPCFPKDRRLAEAFMSGGAQAESAERLKIKQEEQDAREKSRQVLLLDLNLQPAHSDALHLSWYPSRRLNNMNT